ARNCAHAETLVKETSISVEHLRNAGALGAKRLRSGMNGPPLSVGRLDNRRTSLLFKLLLLREHWRRDANRPRFNCCSLPAGLQFLGWRSPQRRNCRDQGRYDYQAGASARRGVEIRRRVAG